MLTHFSGIFVYTVLNGLVGLVVFISGGHIEPREYDLKEYWTWKGSGRPPWFVRAIRRSRNGDTSADVDDDDDAGAATDHTSERVLRAQSPHAGSRTGSSSSAAKESSVSAAEYPLGAISTTEIPSRWGHK